MINKCPICGSTDVEWTSTTMETKDEGFEEYSCRYCRGKCEVGFIITRLVYTGKEDVFPFEQE